MKIDHSPNSTSLDIQLAYNITKMTKTMDRMSISSMLNPSSDELPDEFVVVEKVDEKKEEVEDTKRGYLQTISFHHQLAFHAKPTPVEIGGYAQAYPTPANSPTPSYSSIASGRASQGPEVQCLPSFREVNYAVSHPSHRHKSACYQAELEMLCNANASRLNKAKQLDGHHHSPSSKLGYRRPHSAPSHNHRVNRSDRDSQRRASQTSRTSVQRLQSHQKAQNSATLRISVGLKPTHSNQPYGRVNVHWVRYQKIDLNGKWDYISARYNEFFAGQRGQVTPGGLSSRFYRDNLIPAVDLRGILFYTKLSKLVVLNVQVRTRNKGEHANSPWTFVERHPWAALTYDWVSSEDKVEAARIIAQIEAKEPSQYTRKQQYIVNIRKYDDMPSANQKFILLESCMSPSSYKIENGVLYEGDGVNDEKFSADWEDEELYVQSRLNSEG